MTLEVYRHTPPRTAPCGQPRCAHEVEWVTAVRSKRETPLRSPPEVLRTFVGEQGRLVSVVHVTQTHYEECGGTRTLADLAHRASRQPRPKKRLVQGGLFVLLLLLNTASNFAQSTPPQAQGPPTAPPPPEAALRPCASNPAQLCLPVSMTIGHAPRAFTATDLLGQDPDTIDEHAVCVGRLMRGTFRYFTRGGAPSSTVGTLMPQPPWVVVEDGIDTDPDGTLEPGVAILLYNRALIVGFKATQANSGEAELIWECDL